MGLLNCHDVDHRSTRLEVLLEKSIFTAGNTPNVTLLVTRQGDWVSPGSRASRFPLANVSPEHDIGESRFSLARSSSLLVQGSSRKLICYIFGGSAGKLFGIKLQLDDGAREAVQSRLELMASGEAALEDWTIEPVATPLDQAEAIIEDNEE